LTKVSASEQEQLVRLRYAFTITEYAKTCDAKALTQDEINAARKTWDASPENWRKEIEQDFLKIQANRGTAICAFLTPAAQMAARLQRLGN
jgi:hypothetical protein